MCDDYRYRPELSKDANVILEVLHCSENRRMLGHCLVYKDGRWNVPGIIGLPDKVRDTGETEPCNDSMVERLAKKWADDIGSEDDATTQADARWWLRAIADELGAGLPQQDHDSLLGGYTDAFHAARWLREAAEERAPR